MPLDLVLACSGKSTFDIITMAASVGCQEELDSQRRDLKCTSLLFRHADDPEETFAGEQAAVQDGLNFLGSMAEFVSNTFDRAEGAAASGVAKVLGSGASAAESYAKSCEGNV
mmetsp:Transcript_95133/g.174221  ORF Transcript_95133/g.174221 Transcript_95133/m.174221 type:complete len:113 (+) Transcript_95133:97-435(+)